MKIKNTNSKDKMFGYIKLGRLKKPIADAIGRVPADIYIDYNGLRHIEKGKNFELEKFKLNALDFVKNIVDNFFQIRKGKNNTLILVAKIKANRLDNIAVIELQLVIKESIYVVKTAMPRRKFATDESIIWNE